MLFYTQLFTSKRGPLAKIWLAAHWERKLTKAHVFECNLETTIGDIISPKMEIGLRTSGHLLLGVVRIYSRKAKYLLADCNDAFVKIKIAFRPGETDLPVEGLEATRGTITLAEDFTSFDAQLPDPSDIDMIDHFSQNQSRTEEITLKEDFGNNFLAFTDFGNESQQYTNTLLDMSFHSLVQCKDNFGDEGSAFDLFGDFFTNFADHPVLTDLMPEEPQSTGSEAVERAEPTETYANNETTVLAKKDAAFALEPVAMTPKIGTKRGKRRRKLVVDHTKELSDKLIREQLTNFSDLLTPLDVAPPTLQLMQWKQSGGSVKLFSQLCSAVVAPEIKELFTKSFFQKEYFSGNEKVEQMRQERQEEQGDLGSVTTVNGSDTPAHPEEPHCSETASLDLCSMNEEGTTDRESTTKDKEMTEFSYPELPSEDSQFVHPSHTQQGSQSTSLHTQSLLDSQNFEEKRINKRAQKLLNILKLQTKGSNSESICSLDALCQGGTRSLSATTFACLLALKKQQAVVLHQSAPYQDILVTPGPTFYN